MGPRPTAADGLVLLSHRGTKRYTREVLERARAEGVPTLAIGGVGAPGADIETVAQETAGTFTASHLGALCRLAQLAQALGAELGQLEAVPAAVAAALDAPSPAVELPERGLEFVGAGPTSGPLRKDHSKCGNPRTCSPRGSQSSNSFTARGSHSTDETHSSASTAAGRVQPASRSS